MPAIINADDGAISGASGLKLSSDTSGALNIQTNGVTAIAISASQAVSFPATTSLNFASANITNLTATTLTVSASTYLATASGSVGIGTTSPGEKLSITTASGNSKVRTDSGSNQVYMGWDANSVAEVATNGAWRVRTGGSFAEALRIDTSQNVGIGYTSPNGKLAVNGRASVNCNWAFNDAFIVQSTVANSTAIGAYRADGTTPIFIAREDGNVGIGTSSPVARLDVVGSGTTPPTKIYTSGTSSAITSYSATAGLQLISYQSDTGPFTKTAAIIANADGTAPALLQFWTKANGSSSPSLNATLDPNGNLGVGTTSPLDRLDVVSGAATYRNRFRNSTGGESFLLFQNSDTGTTSQDGLLVGIGNDETCYLYNYENQSLVFGTNNAERARITSGGNVGVNTSSPDNAQLVIKGGTAQTANTYFAARFQSANYSDSGGYTTMLGFGVEAASWSKGGIGYTRTGSYDIGYFGFYLNGSTNTDMVVLADEKARITNGGEFLFGCTSTPSGSVNGIKISCSGSPYIVTGTTNSGSVDHMRSFNPNGQVGALYTTGNTFALYSASDVRRKKDIQEADDSGSIVDAIRVVKHNWKESNEHTRYGFIAQELISVYPEAVKKGDDGEEVQDIWGVSKETLVPLLVKEIQSLRARLAAAGL